MDLLAHLRRQFDYDRWANLEVLGALRAVDLPAATPTMAHIVGVQWLYLDRLHLRGPTMPVWPDLDLDECRAQLDALADAWTVYLTEPDLRPLIPYVNSAGESWSSPVLDILVHVPLHSTYHRGQIAALLIQAGQDPPYTDYIEAARRGFV